MANANEKKEELLKSFSFVRHIRRCANPCLFTMPMVSSRSAFSNFGHFSCATLFVNGRRLKSSICIQYPRGVKTSFRFTQSEQTSRASELRRNDVSRVSPQGARKRLILSAVYVIGMWPVSGDNRGLCVVGNRDGLSRRPDAIEASYKYRNLIISTKLLCSCMIKRCPAVVCVARRMLILYVEKGRKGFRSLKRYGAGK